MTNDPSERVVMVVTADLLARARLEDAAARAGWRVEIATARTLSERLRDARPDLLVLDLDAGRDDLLNSVRDAGPLPSKAVGFLSHVDTALAQAAAEAGLEAMPRGKLWRTLPALLESL